MAFIIYRLSGTLALEVRTKLIFSQLIGGGGVISEARTSLKPRTCLRYSGRRILLMQLNLCMLDTFLSKHRARGPRPCYRRVYMQLLARMRPPLPAHTMDTKIKARNG